MQPGLQTTVPGTSFWAFLVGIDNALNAPPLQGSVNDVEAMRAFLISELQVPDTQICVLKNEEATRATILQTFQNFLIENPAIHPGDQILFQFSGHGSQMPTTTETEPDGYDETIVAYDSRAGAFDIPDKTLASLLDLLADAKGQHITVILDCCHSGSGTRALDREFEAEGMPAVRLAPPNETQPPDDLDVEIQKRGAASRGAGPSGWSTENIPYVLLAACRDDEQAFEYPVKVEGQSPILHGTMTHFLLTQLRQISPHTTYADLHERVAAQVSAEYPTQTPQCEGDRKRVVFGGMHLERQPFITVRRVQADHVTLSAGLVHGLRPGTEIALYPPTTATWTDVTGEPLATASVTTVTATSAEAVLAQVPAESIPPQARAIITRQVYMGLKQIVSLRADEQAGSQEAIERLRQAILHASPTGTASPYLEIADAPEQAFDLYVQASKGVFRIYGKQGQSLVVPEPIQAPGPKDVQSVLQTLEFICRYHTLKSLENEGGSLSGGDIKVRLRKYVQGPKGPSAEVLPETAYSQGGELTVFYQPAQPEQSYYVVEIMNESVMPVYPHVFLLNPDYEIQRFYPRFGQQEVLKAGGTFLIGLFPPDPLRFELPEGWDVSKDFLKVIVTAEPSDLGVLEQMRLAVPVPHRGLKKTVLSPLEQLLETIFTQMGTRHMNFGRTIMEAWATAELSITTVRSSQTIALAAANHRLQIAPGLTLAKPAEFTGRVGIFTLNQAAHTSLDGRMPKVPPALKRFSETFIPVLPPEIKTVDRTPLALRLEIDAQARQKITLDHPLEITFNDHVPQDVVDFFPVVYDGEDYLLAGYQGTTPNSVALVELPSPAQRKDQSLWVMAYQRRRSQAPEGLSQARLSRGKVTYAPCKRDIIQSGQSVALFLHGLTDGTTPLLKQLLPFLQRNVHPYDQVLAWNYIGISTNLQEQGVKLAQALQEQAGAGSDDGIRLDIYAHSSGCLLARYLVEVAGGKEYVDRLILAGPPNRSSPLFKHPTGFRYLVDVSLNNVISDLASPLPWFARELYLPRSAQASMADSALLEQLGASIHASQVPTLVLVGDFVPHVARLKRLNRLAQKVLQQPAEPLFQEANDLVLGLGDMQLGRTSTSSEVTVKSINCDHFHYFDLAESKEVIAQWMREQASS